MQTGVLLAAAAALPLSLCASVESCPRVCTELSIDLPAGRIKSQPDADAYWASQIQAIKAACYVHPANANEVAKIVQTASQYQCEFAIRGGGHSDLPGASNIAKGLVLDLSSFKDVKLSQDKTYAVVGAGNSWGDAYSALDPFNYTVIGGRETTVGVAGLTLGGGLSYFSGQYGFACDNVLAYEVVLANGTIATISQANSPDLYRALRGGGNNFAIVTNFHLAAYKYDLLQGGLLVWNDSAAVQASQVKAFDHFAKTGHHSPAAAMFLSLGYAGDGFKWLDGLYYTQSSPSIPATRVYAPFFNAQLNSSQTLNTQRRGKHAAFASELGALQPSGKREQFHTGMFTADADLLNEIFDMFREIVAKTRKRLEHQLVGNNSREVFHPALAFQPITQTILEAQEKHGGNVLGLDPCGPPLMLLSMSWPWSLAENDRIFIGAMDEVVRRSNAAAERRGLKNDFIYMNYASPGQAVVRSYGAANVHFMKEMSAKYDPKQVFQRLVPGGFKLD